MMESLSGHAARLGLRAVGRRPVMPNLPTNRRLDADLVALDNRRLWNP